MPVGAPLSVDQVNNMITSYAVRLRDLSKDISDLSLRINGQGTGLAFLESIGFSSDPNPANPGGVSDAELAQSMISYENTVAGVYYGEATQATAFNFEQELSQVWGGQ